MTFYCKQMENCRPMDIAKLADIGDFVACYNMEDAQECERLCKDGVCIEFHVGIIEIIHRQVVGGKEDLVIRNRGNLTNENDKLIRDSNISIG